MSWEIDTESHRALVFCSAAPRIPRMPRIPRRPWSNSCVTRLRAWPIACRRRSSSCMRTDGISSALYGQPMDHYFGKWSTNGWNGLADFLTHMAGGNPWVFLLLYCWFCWLRWWPFQKMCFQRWQELQHEQESMDREMKREQEQRGPPMWETKLNEGYMNKKINCLGSSPSSSSSSSSSSTLGPLDN